MKMTAEIGMMQIQANECRKSIEAGKGKGRMDSPIEPSRNAASRTAENRFLLF